MSAAKILRFIPAVGLLCAGGTLHGSTFVEIVHPNAPITSVFRINKFGSIVGSWVDSSGITRGFKLVSKTFQPVVFPGAKPPHRWASMIAA